jgi:hypothetical protein
MEALVLVAFAGFGLLFFFSSVIRICTEKRTQERTGAIVSFRSTTFATNRSHARGVHGEVPTGNRAIFCDKQEQCGFSRSGS